jgi:LysM repeat protein
MQHNIRLIAIVLAMIFLAAALSSCQLLDRTAQPSVPSLIRGQATAVPPSVDESPRIRGAQDVPPTWTPAAAEQSETPVFPEVAATAPAGSQATYTVEEGDTLAEIAIRFNVTMDALARANDIEDFDHIEIGQVLVIPR